MALMRPRPRIFVDTVQAANDGGNKHMAYEMTFSLEGGTFLLTPARYVEQAAIRSIKIDIEDLEEAILVAKSG